MSPILILGRTMDGAHALYSFLVADPHSSLQYRLNDTRPAEYLPMKGF
jgi:hypothetical protein